MAGDLDLFAELTATRRKLLQGILKAADPLHQQLPATQRAALSDSPQHRQRLGNFLALYYSKVAENDLREYSPQHLASAALGHWQLGRVRTTQQHCLRIHNPILDGRSSTPHTSVELIASDMPFLVDSISMVFARFGLNVHLIVHPVLHVKRNAQGKWLSLTAAPHTGASAESWQRYEIDRVSDPVRLEQLHTALESALQDVSSACQDWHAMRTRALDLCHQWAQTSPPVAAAELHEAETFLHWLVDNHFTFLGSQQFTLKHGKQADQLIPVADSALGVMRAGSAKSSHSLTLKDELRDFARKPRLLFITKSGSMATVHRAAHLDQVSIKHIDNRGVVTGETRFLGLFTSNVYSLNPRVIPLLRHKLERVVEGIGNTPGSHDAKAVQHVIDNYPRDELFQSSVADLVRTIRSIVNLYERRRVRLFLRRDPFKRYHSCLLFLPRDRYNTQVRERIEGHLLAALGGNEVESQVLMSDSALARLHLQIRRAPDAAREPLRAPDEAALEQDITHLIRTWHDELSAILTSEYGETEGRSLAEHYGHAFPAAYQADVAPAAALIDLQQLSSVTGTAGGMELRLTEIAEHLHLRIVRSGAPLPLSDVLPVLENLGLRVLTERPYEIEPQRAKSLWIQDFELQPQPGIALNSPRLNELFHDAFLAIWQGQIENDGFNKLIVKALLGWREVNVLRAYCRYLLQSGLTFSQRYMEQTLATHAGVANLLWQLFEARFDPAFRNVARVKRIAALTRDIESALDNISSPDQDRMLRSYLTVINASLRTNYYQRDAQGKPRAQLSFKLSSGDIGHLPLPKPLYEIFVHSPRVEGVHLRMGKVARGGLRWSDRREDFRTEVLGLMKAQNVKNSVIVPVGAKGGFVSKQIPVNATREQIQQEGIECYRSFVRGLLDITDNIVAGNTIAPSNVVRHDHDDPYLVVAADKGTASFSDIANAVAAEYQFWLGDAFASGGSAGYDHKKMAITARGAWECVKRHCRELSINVEQKSFTACGIGDMAGDVFGNGMLRSQHMKLLAAFNHQHIFIDPNPDPAASFKERQRLFNLPRSSWEDYDAKLISAGGGVYSRSAKSIALSPAARTVLGIDDASLTPQALIQAILRMPVDLLWNGGIGTYVKAGAETHLDVGDRSNDAVRVNGRELRCKVVGEGGNLGFTQRGRIEYALSGGRLNTDFIDNSAGVDCSDHEVNIKILLSLASTRELPASKRNALLTSMTDEMAQLVLRDNYLQSQALSMAELDAVARLQEHAHLIRALEQSHGLDRVLEGLPDAETIQQRQLNGHGLTRPEMSILLSYSKMALYKRLISTDIATDSYLAQELQRYFPAALNKRFSHLLPQHRLAREIITTAVTNSLVNRMGPSFATRAEEDTGADAGSITRAYAIAREVFDMRELWQKLEVLDNRVTCKLQYEIMNGSTRLLRFGSYWLINHYPAQLDIQHQVERLRSGMRELRAVLPELLDRDEQVNVQAARKQLLSQGVTQELANWYLSMDTLNAGFDMVELSAKHKRPVAQVAQLYFALDQALSLAWLRHQIGQLKAQDRWQAVARNTLRDQLHGLQRSIAGQILARYPKLPINAALPRWQQDRQLAVSNGQQIMSAIRSVETTDFATLSVALQSVRQLTTD